jgi:hypothetical protein
MMTSYRFMPKNMLNSIAANLMNFSSGIAKNQTEENLEKHLGEYFIRRRSCRG